MTEIGFIEELLKEGSSLILEKLAVRKEVEVRTKGAARELVTEVDLAVQKALTDRIRSRFTGDHVFAEEGDASAFPDHPEDRCWVMDPMDGTQNFVRGLFPHLAVSIAFAVGGQAMASGVVVPATGDVFLAERRSGAYRGSQRLMVSDMDRPELARVEVDFSHLNERQDLMRRARDVFFRFGNVRCHGSAVVGMCQIATGDMDAFIHMRLNPWDYAAAQLIVEEAGGKTSRLDGSPLQLFDRRWGVAASNGLLHEPLLSAIQP